MKNALLALACTAFAAAGASAQSNNSIYFALASNNSAYQMNCASIGNSIGVPANGFSVDGTDPSSVAGSGLAAGRTTLSSFTINRSVDQCTESLLNAFVVGGQYRTLTLTQYGLLNQRPYARSVFTLTGVVVSNYAISGSNASEPSESVSFSYEQMCVATTDQNTNGTLQQTVTVCYDQLANRVL